MFGNFSKRAVALLTMVLSVFWLGVPAFAFSPATGDETQLLLPIMGGLLAVSIILVIVYVVLSAKKNK